MRPVLVVLCLVLTFTTPVNPATTALHYTKYFFDDGDFITATGMWRVENPTKKTEITLSETKIECYKTGGMQLVSKNAYCMEATVVLPANLDSQGPVF
jgi:hypothetical protein